MIDTKRLATDAAYWRGCGAPEDAQEFGFSNGYFYKQENGTWFYFSRRNTNTWQECSMGQPLDDNLIPRPQAPEAEWAGGLPGVGVECEGYVLDTSKRWVWVAVEVLKQHNEQECAVYVPSMGVLRWCDQFRPIRTPEQRQREELKALGRAAYIDGASTHAGGINAATDAILSRYNLEPKP